MTKIINMVNHEVTILNAKDQVIKVFPKGQEILRLVEHIENVDVVDGVLITRTTYTEPENLPKETQGVYYIVSQMLKNNLPHRNDLLVPTNIKRDENGLVLGAHALGI